MGEDLEKVEVNVESVETWLLFLGNCGQSRDMVVVFEALDVVVPASELVNNPLITFKNE